MKTEAIRFILAGAVNTMLGYGLYLAFLRFLPYFAAYSASYVIGVVASYSLNTWFVFREPWRWRRLAAYPVVYVVQYLIGIALLGALVQYLRLPVELAPLLVVAFTLPVTFVLSRYIIKGKSPA